MKLTTALFALIAIHTSQAAIVLDNATGTVPVGIITFKGTSGVVPYQEFGMTLHVDDVSDFQFNSLTIDFASALNTGGPAELSLWTAGMGSPQGTLLANLLGPMNPSGIVATYTPDVPVTLSADTDVFVLFKVSAATGFYRINGATDPFVVEDWTYGGGYQRSLTGSWTSVAFTPRMQVDATPVPEPGVVALLGGAVLLLGFRRMRVAQTV